MNTITGPSRYRRNMFLNLAAAAACVVTAVVATACSANESPAANAAPVAAAPTPAARPSAPVDELVAINGGRLHVRCRGEGNATIVLVAGFESDATGWAKVEPALAKRARVCAYDRFGAGTSDRARATQTFATQADDLHALLTKIGEPGPYVVVGHSFGGAEAVEFASRFANDVTGLVLVDASPTSWRNTVCAVPAYTPLCAQLSNPSMNRERLDGGAAFAAVRTITSLGSLPMTIITGDKRQTNGLPTEDVTLLNRAWNEGQQAWAALSTSSNVVTLDNTGHYIQLDRPADVIREISARLPH